MGEKVGGFIYGGEVVLWPFDEGAIRVNYKYGVYDRWIFLDWISLVENLKVRIEAILLYGGNFVFIAYEFLILFLLLVHTHVHFLNYCP